MGQTKRKKRKKSSGEVSIKEVVYWVGSTFHWTLSEIYELPMSELDYLMDGASIFNAKQEKRMKSKSPARKHSVNSLGELSMLPGVKTIRRPKRLK